MDYKKKYVEALERARAIYNSKYKPEIAATIAETLRNVFPELTELDDERIMKTLIKFHKATIDIDGIKGSNIVDWLEKQVPEPNWCHHKVDLSGYSEEYRKAYYDGWNNCNMQHSQCKIELDDVVKCLINGMKFYYEDNEDATWGTEKWSMPVKHIIDVLEKKGEQKSTDKAEPKFHEGDWIISNNKKSTYQVIEVKRGIYVIRDNVDNHEYHIGIEEAHKSGRLWTIEDAKPGDVLASGQVVFMFKMIHGVWLNCYCSLHNDGSFIADAYDLLTEKYFSEVHPATKEQRDSLERAITNAGYRLDKEKLKLEII